MTSVLVVDDQRPFRLAARLVVDRLAGWQVVAEAETGAEGIELAGRLEPDLVLMDFNMADIDGLEATERIVASKPATVVFIVSTYSREDLPADPSACGAKSYIRKEDLTPSLLEAEYLRVTAERCR